MLGSEEAPGAEEETDEHDRETLHRLCPTYAKDINSPLRHVRTRIYFTSESHVHSLINVLRFCHLGECLGNYLTHGDLVAHSRPDHACASSPLWRRM